ncbi:MAG: STN and carboxypeptidase regulatory-like domain-containing protein, partial [Bacteroidota bacterium]
MNKGYGTLKMKSLFSWFLLFMIVATSNPCQSQDLEKKITVQCKLKPLSVFLDEVSRAGAVRFSYNPQSIPLQKIITCKARNRPIREILDQVLIPLGISYSMIEKHIVLVPVSGETVSERSRKSKPTQRFTISGYVKEKSTGEALIGANVFV